MTISATYVKADGQTKETVRLGRITRPPYKVVWSTAEIPNQLLTGVTLSAEAELIDGGRLTVHREGVFLAPHRWQSPQVDVSRMDGFGREESGAALTLSGPDTIRSASARVYWDRQNLVFAVTVRDPSFGTALPESVLRATGCEILLDLADAARPYPADSVVAFYVPVVGQLQRRRYAPSFAADGSYSLGTRLEPAEYPHSVKTASGKGWKAVCAVPPALLGRLGRQQIRANIVARIGRADGTTALYAWTGATPQEIYAPLRWGTLVIKERSLTRNPLVLYAIGVAAGLLLVLGGCPLLRRCRGSSRMVLPFETPEGERKIADMVLAFVESKVTDRRATIEDVAREFAIEPHRIEQLLKKYCGQSFLERLTELRIALAKERLRSSNASEISIAEQCGFKNADEMERMFLKYCRVTPYKFRLEQQVS